MLRIFNLSLPWKQATSRQTDLSHTSVEHYRASVWKEYFAILVKKFFPNHVTTYFGVNYIFNWCLIYYSYT